MPCSQPFTPLAYEPDILPGPQLHSSFKRFQAYSSHWNHGARFFEVPVRIHVRIGGSLMSRLLIQGLGPDQG